MAYIREVLDAYNLLSTYRPASLSPFRPRAKASPSVQNFRTADGSWNSLTDPKEGAAGTRFLRNIDLSAVQPKRASDWKRQTRAR